MQPPEQRLFFALWPDASSRQKLERLARQLPEHHGRMTHPLDWHVTLVFLGSVTIDRLPCVQQAADRIEGRGFQLRLDRFDYWRRPRILCCGSSQTPEQLSRLVSDLQSGLETCGFRPETRPYTPHITLARKARAIDLQPPASAIHWRVGEFVLAASSCAGRPPRYQVLKRWALAD